jgi:hypothetical protein
MDIDERSQRAGQEQVRNEVDGSMVQPDKLEGRYHIAEAR